MDKVGKKHRRPSAKELAAAFAAKDAAKQRQGEPPPYQQGITKRQGMDAIRRAAKHDDGGFVRRCLGGLEAKKQD